MLTEIKTKTEHFFVDEFKRKQGEYRRYTDSGVLVQHSNFLNNLFHGIFLSYYECGQLFCYVEYDNGRFHGEYTWYEKNGTVIRSTWYHNDWNTKINPKSLTEKDRLYIKMSGRLPQRD